MTKVGGAILAITLAVVCCGLLLLLVGGASIGAGALLDEMALGVIGLGVIAFAVYRAARRRRGL